MRADVPLQVLVNAAICSSGACPPRGPLIAWYNREALPPAAPSGDKPPNYVWSDWSECNTKANRRLAYRPK